MTRRSSIILCLAALLLAGVTALWRVHAPSRPPQVSGLPSQVSPATGIVTAATNSHRPLETYSKTGDTRALPENPSLEEALSYTSRLSFAKRLKAIHAFGRSLATTPLTEAQADFLRTFVADRRLPENVTLHQVRALKNDVLNILCVHPGGEAATAAMLRNLYADKEADPGLRDYALQHLVSLTERDPSLGWDAHWLAIESDNTALAATALLHLAIQHRTHLRVQGSAPSDLLATHYSLPATSLVQPSTSALSSAPQVSGLKSQVSAAAVRIASDRAAPDPARTTALRVCGELQLTEALPLANEIARSDRVGIPLRIAAIATLGDLGGDTNAHAFLQTLATGPEKRLRVPAQSALKRLSIN